MRRARRCRCSKARLEANILQLSAYAGLRRPFRRGLSKPVKYRRFDKLSANGFFGVGEISPARPCHKPGACRTFAQLTLVNKALRLMVLPDSMNTPSPV